MRIQLLIDVGLRKLISIIIIIITTPIHHTLVTVGQRMGGASPGARARAPRVMVGRMAPRWQPGDGTVVGTEHQHRRRVHPVVRRLGAGDDPRQLAEGREGGGMPEVLRQGAGVVPPCTLRRLQGGVVELVEQVGGGAPGPVVEQSQAAAGHRRRRRRGEGVVGSREDGGVEVGSGRDARVALGQRQRSAGDFLGSLLQKTMPPPDEYCNGCNQNDNDNNSGNDDNRQNTSER